jgi:FKBP-type peptidyl-prolyl cis-trans isomerase (trigger factor)
LATEGLFETLKKQLASDGVTLEDYLKSINKTEDELKKGFANDAVLKIKLDALIAEVIDSFNIKVDDKEIETEVNEVLRRYKSVAQASRDINLERLTEYVHDNLLYQKAVEHIRNQVKVG